MFEVSSEMHFAAAHHLREYNGPCENVHGHNWLVRATVRSEKLDNIGLVMDFKILKQNLKDVLAELDHNDLNKIFTESLGNPSSENISRYIFKKLSERLNSGSCKVSRIDVWETPGNCASYFENA